MSPGLLAALELVLVLGGVLGLAVWELVRLRRERARDETPLKDERRRDPP